jgi:hypothetical protein
LIKKHDSPGTLRYIARNRKDASEKNALAAGICGFVV